MRLSHIYLAAVAVVTLGFVAAAPGAADGQDANAPQDTEPPAEAAETAPPVEPAAPHDGAEEWTEFRSWPVERRAEYEAWPLETQTYYWTLTRERQALFWRLPDEDKIALTAMTGPEREAAWAQLESRASTPPAP